MPMLDAALSAALDALDARSLRRTVQPGEGGPGGTLRRGDRVLLNLSGNDYLGLGRHPLLAERAAEWGRRWGTGAGASRLVTGTLPPHRRIEDRLAVLKRREAALLFASGWQLNAAVLPALLALPGEPHPPVVFADRLIHASLHHGLRAANVRQHRFAHNDLDHLSTLLHRTRDLPGRRWIITESVFSMDGDRADLPALRRLADEYGAVLFVDEAHATGVLGPGGAGLSVAAADAGAGPPDIVMGTLSKALGGFGAFLAGSRLLCDWIANTCSGFIHTTALPPTVLGAVDAALDLLPGLDDDRARLQSGAEGLRDRLRAGGIDVGTSSTQIVPVLLGSPDRAVRVSAALAADGILATAIRPPTVPPNGSRLRLALGSAHPPEAIDRVADAVIRHAG
ncbi:MAG: 8-amino-7-oxononanoate synthase [Gluconacetobacter diazotrophicus]|nr:8-amino-7-oxononanoate synthase [Gluconacetobacter diazotrophicus]